jgi:DNA repair exonuclease SbcCD ATPase subunit
MVIKELKLLSFGKFKDKSLSMKDGINVIFGNNEAGKSTIHRFIEGILYGHSFDMEKYKPWNSREYKGEFIYESRGKEVKISRNFEENETNIIDNRTGEDISFDFSVNKKTGVLEPGKTIFGMNRRTFKNTFSINQLGSKTDEEILLDIKCKIENISKAKDENIIIKDTYKYLKDKLNNIGNSENLSDEYGFVINKINSLKKEIEKRIDLDLKFKRKLMLLDSYKKEYQEIEANKEKLSFIINEISPYDFKENYNNALSLTKEIEELTEEIGISEADLEINIEEYEKLIRIISKIEQLDHESKHVSEQITNLNEEIEVIKSKHLISGNSDEFKKIDSNYEMLVSNDKIIKRLENKINEINNEIKIFESKEYEQVFAMYEKYNANQREVKYLKDLLDSEVATVLSNKSKKEKTKRTTNIFFSILLIGLILVGSHIAVMYYENNMFYVALSSVIIPLYLLKGIGRNSRLIKGIKKEIEEINSENSNHKIKLTKLNEDNKKIFEESECNSFNELKARYNIAFNETGSIEEKRKSLETLEEEFYFIKKKSEIIEEELLNKIRIFGYSELNNEIINEVKNRVEEANRRFEKLKELELELESLKKEMEEIVSEKRKDSFEVEEVFKRNNVKSTEELKRLIKEQRNFQDKIISRKTKIEELKKYTGDLTLKELEDKVIKIEEFLNNSEFSSREEIMGRYNDCLLKSQELNEKIGRLKENLDEKIGETRILSEIEEEVYYYENKKIMLEKEKGIINEAIEIIQNISKSNQEEFIPKLKRKTDYYLNLITGSKYSEIIIEEDMSIGIFDPNNKMKVNIDSLSAGTIDQIYFAVRVALVDILSKDKKSPILLDDCFTQYDRGRLLNSVNILSEIGKNRQIILFTCHLREKEILEQMNFEYNYIEL